MRNYKFLCDVFIFWKCVLITIAVEEGDQTDRYFIKDDGMETKFPPKITRSIYEEIPTGHLRSLGYQRIPEGAVEKTKNVIQPKDFFSNYVIKNIPLILTNMVAEEQPIRVVWTDERLKKMHGKSKVWVIKHHQHSNKDPQQITLERFIDFYKLQDIYLATTIPEEFMSELMLPAFMECGPIVGNLVETELWMAYGGTGSLLHYHGDHQVHCMADGRKDFILIDNKYKKSLRMTEKHPFTGEGYSKIDTEIVNMFEEKDIGTIPWVYASLIAGDCLFIPAGCIHQVRSYGRSLSYTMQFASTFNKTLTNCNMISQDQVIRSLLEYDFIYTERDGVQQLKNIKLTEEDLRNILFKLIRTASILPYERFQYFYNTAIRKAKQKMPSAQVVFNNLDLKAEGFITLEQIKKLPGNQLNKVAKILNSVHKARHDEL